MCVKDANDLDQRRVADQRHRAPPCRSSARVTTVRSRSPSPWSTTRCHSSAKAGERRESTLVGCLEREVHVLEREGQGELRREVILENALQLGCLPRRRERAA